MEPLCLGSLAALASARVSSRSPSRSPMHAARSAFERQRRGVLHVHPVLGFATPAERHAAYLYAGYLEKFAAQYGFGFTERRLRKLSSKAAAGYLFKYFVTGKKARSRYRSRCRRRTCRTRSFTSRTSSLNAAVSRCASFAFAGSSGSSRALPERHSMKLARSPRNRHSNPRSFSRCLPPSPRHIAQILGREPPGVRS